MLSTSTVLAVFFGGLAIGSWAFGKWSAKTARPVRGYAVIELAVASLGLMTHAGFRWADDLLGRAQHALGDGSPQLVLVRLLLVCVVLLPAATGMGATLPLMVAAYGSRRARGADPVAVLYGVNTLGATAGAATTGFYLIPAIGLTRAIALAASANLLAAALAWRIRPPDAGPEPRAESAGATPAPAIRRAVAAIFFVSGFVALANEVLWTRYLGLLVRNTVHTFTLSLTAVLAGIMIGSLLTSGRPRRTRALAWTFGALQVGIGLYVVTLTMLPPAAWQRLGSGPLLTIALFLPPSILSGASFPIAIRWIAERNLGPEVGRMAALNILGGIVGSLAAGFIGLPREGLAKSLLFSTGTSVALGVIAWLLALGAGAAGPKRGSAPRARATRDRAIAALLAAVSVLLWIVIPRRLGTRVPQDFLGSDGPLVDFREGMLSNVAVVRVGPVLQMQIDRWWQGQDTRTHQIMAAHVPMLLHGGARSVLVVGVGAGQTASRFLDYPIERLDVVDIEPAVFDLLRPHFPAAWLDDRRVHLIREDGRNFVAHTRRSYDVISLEVGQVFRPGVGSFYTREFYGRAKDRLAPGGMVCQFVPLPFLGVEEFRGIIATFLGVFPEATLWYNTSELLLIGRTSQPIRLDPARLAPLTSDATISKDLEYSHWAGPARWLRRPTQFLSTFLCGPPGLRALARGAAFDTDDRPVLEYATANVNEGETRDAVIADSLRAYLDVPGVLLAMPEDSSAAVVAARERNLADIAASAKVRQADLLGTAGRSAEMERLLDRAIELNPENLAANRMRAGILLQTNRPAEARQAYDATLRIDPADPVALRGLGTLFLMEKRFGEAEALFRAALALQPGDADAHSNLGVALGSRGDLAGAAAQFREAVRLRPDFVDAQVNLKRTEDALRSRAGSR